MESDELKKLARNAMGAPFRIRMTGGEQFEVRHPDFITVSEYHAAVVMPEDGVERLNILTLVNISTVEMLPTPAEA
ncbi:MAG: hypothetical protein AAGJ46_14255 [Planctomycetota bacterium]